MEALTRIVADSLARHGLDRPVDPRRLQWSRWSRCDSPRSLLVVPSKPGIFALAEEIMDLGPSTAQGASKAHVGTAALGCPTEQSSAAASSATTAGAGKDRYGHDVSPAVGSTDREGRDLSPAAANTDREGHDFSSEPALSKRSAPKGAVKPAINDPASAAEALWGGAALQRCDSLPEKNPPSAAEIAQRRMLAVLQFSEDDDMAFTLDRMFTRINPMRDRLASGRCFLRFVVIEDETQRRTICAALNQWMLTSAEKATGLPSDFSSSLELASMGAGSGTTRVGRTLPSASSGQALSDSASRIPKAAQVQPLIDPINSTPYLDSGASKNLHCPHPLPSGF